DGERLAVSDDEAAQRCAVVVRCEASFCDLPKRHERNDFFASQRNIGERLDIDDGADEDVDARGVFAPDDGERLITGGESGEEAWLRWHGVAFWSGLSR